MGYPESESGIGVLDMFDRRRRGKVRSDKFTPFLKLCGPPEADGVVFEGFPTNGEGVFVGGFDCPVQAPTHCTLGLPEQGHGLCCGCFEIALGTPGDGKGGDF
jgi:hypothetical protein